ncbi:MAG TPA: AmmeMemoRadiSam system protein B [Polyangiaceae bacterium]
MPAPNPSHPTQATAGSAQPSLSKSDTTARAANGTSASTASHNGALERRVRRAAVAGSFYSGDRDTLKADVETLLAAATSRHLPGLRALICPHAGYQYSGPIAASGYKLLMGHGFERVVLLGPSHRVAFEGVALPDADALETPLGPIDLDAEARTALLGEPFRVDAAPHAKEHSLEVQLPFLQLTLGRFSVVPLVFGDVDSGAVEKRLESLVDKKTLFIASSDLSHYYPYAAAKVLDHATVQAILALDTEAMKTREACGKGPILALMQLAQSRHWKPTLIDQRNSGDTAGDRSRVVGYASIAFTETR